MRDFNTSLSPQVWSSSTKLNKILEITDMVNQTVLTGAYRPFHPNTKEYALFSEPFGTFSKLSTYSDTQQVSTETKTLETIP